MAVAKVFRSGNSQAVRLPKEFRLEADEVEISRVGDGLLLQPAQRNDMAQLIALLQSLPDDMSEGIKDDRPPEPVPDWPDDRQ